MTSPHLPAGRIPVPLEVQLLLVDIIDAKGKAQTKKLLGVGEHTLEDLIAPGATMIAKTLTRIVDRLHTVQPNAGATP